MLNEPCAAVKYCYLMVSVDKMIRNDQRRVLDESTGERKSPQQIFAAAGFSKSGSRDCAALQGAALVFL